MSVAFLSGYYLTRDSQIERDNNIRTDIMDDGTPRVRVLGSSAWVTVQAKFQSLTGGEKDALVAFLATNRAEEITWTIDGTAYIGRVISTVRESMTGNRYSVEFVYRAKEA